MTNRDLGEIGVKLIGVYFAALTPIGLTYIPGVLAQPSMEGWPSRPVMIVFGLLPLLGRVAVAWACLVWGREIAARVLAENQAQFGGASAKDLLVVGLALLGVGLAVDAIPGLLELAGKAVWYAQGARQSQFLPSMEHSWQAVANDALKVIVGGVLAMNARRVGSIVGRSSGVRGDGRQAG